MDEIIALMLEKYHLLDEEVKTLKAENEKLKAQLTAQQSVDVVDGDGC